MAFVEVQNKRGSYTRVQGAYHLLDVLSCCKSGFSSKNGVKTQLYKISVTLSENSMKSARFIVGDYVQILVDDETPNKVLIKRVTEGGYMLTCGEPKKNKGKSVRAYINIALDPLFKIKIGQHLYAKSQLTEDGLIFNFQ